MIQISMVVSSAFILYFFTHLAEHNLSGFSFPGSAWEHTLPQTPNVLVNDKDRSTISRSTHSVWYDSNERTVHPIRGSKSIYVDDRHDSIAGNTKPYISTWWSDFLKSWSDFFSVLFRSWQILLIVCAIVILSLVGFLFFRYGWDFQSRTTRTTRLSDEERETAKILDLPFELEQSAFGLLAQAERHRASGDFSKAIIYLFSHALVEMDSAGCIRLERGKTNRVYLRELRDRECLAGFTDQLVSAFEYAFFGKHVLSQDVFEGIWQQIPAFDAYLKQVVSNPSQSPGSSGWRWPRSVVMIACCIAAILLSGCRNSLSTQYGLSEGIDAKYSPASVSLFRNLCNADGRSTLMVRSFSPRAMSKLQAIVWSPDAFELHQAETMAWIDRWLATGDRTLIYVGRDFSPTADYWSQAASKFSNSQTAHQDALSAREQQAIEWTILDRMRSRLRTKVATPWCLFNHEQGFEERVGELKGPWSAAIDASNARLFIRSYPMGYAEESLVVLQKEFDWEPVDTAAKPTGVNDYEPQWQTSDATMLGFVKALKPSDVPALDCLLATNGDKPLVSEISKPSWGNSRVILLSNSSLISNISLTNYENLAIAKKLVARLPKQNIGFLTGAVDPRVRKDDNSDQQKGFEMLTIWPLNVISLHAVFLGMLVLLAVYPIFGRAKRLPSKSTRDFGQHIEAVGGLLFKSQDRFYAVATIAEYFRNVRNEPTSPWANVESVAHQEPTSPFKS